VCEVGREITFYHILATERKLESCKAKINFWRACTSVMQCPTTAARKADAALHRGHPGTVSVSTETRPSPLPSSEPGGGSWSES